MMIERILLGLSLGLGIGLPITKYASYDSPYDINRTNVYYDLAVLYGDSNKDGHVDDSEYKTFDIDSIAPQGNLGEETSFKYLGTLPNGVNQLYLYLYSEDRIDDCQLNDNRLYDYSSCTYSYSLDYYNASEIKDDGTGYENDTIKTSQLQLINFYSSSKGYFYKFTIPDYVAVESSEQTYRFKPRSMRVLTADGTGDKTFDFGTDNEFELHYDANCKEENAVFKYFSEDTYELEAVQDLWLASESSEVEDDNLLFWIVSSRSEMVDKAREVFYVFFNFKDDSFQPDEIKEVYWHTNVRDYSVTSYYCTHKNEDFDNEEYLGGSKRTIYDGTYTNFIPEEVPLYQWETQTTSRQDGKSYSLSGTTKAESLTVEQTFDNDFLWKHDTIVKSYSIPKIVDTANMNGYEPTDDEEKENFQPFKDFIQRDDHKKYHWAYAIDADLHREIVNDTVVAEHSHGSYNKDIYRLYSYDTLCHDLYGTVTLGMKVVHDNQTFDIRTIHDPLTTRNAYLIGMPAPTLWDFVANDVSNFFQQWWWVFLLVGLFIIAILAMIFQPVMNVVKAVFKGIWFIVKLIIDIVYVALVWWWLAIIKKAKGEDVPPIWLFDGQGGEQA